MPITHLLKATEIHIPRAKQYKAWTVVSSKSLTEAICSQDALHWCKILKLEGPVLEGGKGKFRDFSTVSSMFFRIKAFLKMLRLIGHGSNANKL